MSGGVFLLARAASGSRVEESGKCATRKKLKFWKLKAEIRRDESARQANDERNPEAEVRMKSQDISFELL